MQKIRPADAALLTTLGTVLAFRPLRFEPFEAEKAGLLMLLAAVVVGAAITERRARIGPRGNPLRFAVGALLAATVISTLLSLSVTRSLWGAAYRSQGLATFLAYMALFWGAARMRGRAPAMLLPFLVMAAVPLCVFALLQAYAIGPDFLRPTRPGSTTGHPNFLAAWLVMALLYIVPHLGGQVVHARRVTKSAALLGAVCALMLGTLAMLGSRGAVLSLGVGALTGAVIVAARRRARRALLVIAVSVAIMGAGYLLLSRSAGDDGASGIARLLRPYDEYRAALWSGAAGMLAHQADPLYDANGAPDRLAALRPFVGYGPDTIDQTHSRLVVYSPTLEAVFTQESGALDIVDRLHNLVFDARATTGWLGLAATLAVYEAALYMGLRRLGLISGRWWTLPAAQIAGALPGLAAASPPGAALGAAAGTLLWIGGRAFAPGGSAPGRCDWTVVGIVCVVAAQWVDNQFGFATTAPQALWWILLGRLSRLTAETGRPWRDSHHHKGAGWYWGALVMGLFVVHGMEQTQVNVPGGMLLPAALVSLLPLIWIVGLLGARFDRPAGARPTDWRRASQIVLVWAVFIAVKQITNAVAARTLAPGSVDAAALYGLGFLLALGGIGVGAAAVFLQAGVRRITRRAAAILALFLLIGGAVYALRYMGAFAHHTANNFRGDAAAWRAADIAFEVTTTCAPDNTQARIHRLYLLRSRTGDDVPARIAAEIAAIYRLEPFIVNAWEWRVGAGGQ
ncbi:MAG: O-antigen ligase family protein [Anaerolineae bacterium]|nr:O-antigen ligase family protein [Anaerolineae bacterium]